MIDLWDLKCDAVDGRQFIKRIYWKHFAVMLCLITQILLIPSSQAVKSMILIDTNDIQLCVHFSLWRGDIVDVDNDTTQGDT